LQKHDESIANALVIFYYSSFKNLANMMRVLQMPFSFYYSSLKNMRVLHSLCHCGHFSIKVCKKLRISLAKQYEILGKELPNERFVVWLCHIAICD
jgi:hypothetical protein